MHKPIIIRLTFDLRGWKSSASTRIVTHLSSPTDALAFFCCFMNSYLNLNIVTIGHLINRAKDVTCDCLHKS